MLEATIDLRRGGFRLQAAFTLDPGDAVIITGPNGSGKTTLLHAIAGLCPLDAGRIEDDGEVLDDGSSRFVLPERRGFGYAFQDRRLFPNLNALDNVAFGLQCRGVARTAARDQAYEELAVFGADAVARVRPADLSGGEAQRVALARTLVLKPRVLLLDEPFSPIDSSTRTEVREVLRERVRSASITTLLVTHDLEDLRVLQWPTIRLDAGVMTPR